MKNESLCSVVILSKIDKWQIKICIQFSFFFLMKANMKKIFCAQGPVMVARTYLFARWLFFWIGFFGRNDLTDFYDFWHP